MAGFSIDTALKSGFRLAKREPLAVFVWGIGYALLGLLIQAIALGPALPGYLATVGQDPEAAAAQMERAASANALWTLPIMMILGVGAAAVFYGAVVRALLHPEERGFFYLRVSRRELWLILTSFALLVGMLLVVMAGAFVLGMLGSLAGGWGMLFAFPAVVGFVYLAARFSTAWVQSFDEKRLVVLDGWRMTRGQGWRILLMLLALLFLLLIVAVVIMIPAAIVGGILLGVAGMAGGAGGAVVTAVVAIAALVLFSGCYGVFLAVAVAPYVEVYRSLKGLGLPGGETAEVFA
jgi:MFS family permease